MAAARRSNAAIRNDTLPPLRDLSIDADPRILLITKPTQTKARDVLGPTFVQICSCRVFAAPNASSTAKSRRRQWQAAGAKTMRGHRVSEEAAPLIPDASRHHAHHRLEAHSWRRPSSRYTNKTPLRLQIHSEMTSDLVSASAMLMSPPAGRHAVARMLNPEEIAHRRQRQHHDDEARKNPSTLAPTLHAAPST